MPLIVREYDENSDYARKSDKHITIETGPTSKNIVLNNSEAYALVYGIINELNN